MVFFMFCEELPFWDLFSEQMADDFVNDNVVFQFM